MCSQFTVESTNEQTTQPTESSSASPTIPTTKGGDADAVFVAQKELAAVTVDGMEVDARSGTEVSFRHLLKLSMPRLMCVRSLLS